MLCTEKKRGKYTYFSNIKNEFIKSSLDESFSNILNRDAGKTIEKLILKYLARNENYGIGDFKDYSNELCSQRE